MIKFRELKLVLSTFWWCLKSETYRLQYWKDGCVGFNLRVSDKEEYDRIYSAAEKSYENGEYK